MAVIRGNTGAGDQGKVPNYRAKNKTMCALLPFLVF